ncbi:serine hydrolase domain-containing protein [Streptomyces sp. NPDC005251]|uniref:serine hydrolase domain-containing protein n=1 Tax=Streptomyces sp. NPDC005251 TaxID=3157166 RepID=UPI0033B5FA62
MTTAHGTVVEGFESVREEFASFVAAEAHDPGAQLVVYADGKRVVDLVSSPDIAADSLLGVFSSTKGAAHLVVALLVQDAILDLDREVAYYWPEFAAEGKGAITLRELLAHQAGVVGVDGGFSPAEIADDRALAARLAGQRPYWRPGAGFGYHAFVIGALTGEVVFRATGRTLHEWYEERIRAPYGLDFFLGLPESEEPRFLTTLPMLPTPSQQAEIDAAPWANPNSIGGISFNAPRGLDLAEFPNDRAVRAAGQSSAGGIASARGLAGLYQAAVFGLADRPPLLKPDVLAEFARPHSIGTDLSSGQPQYFALGFHAMSLKFPSLAAGAFGHSGAAGSQALADPVTGFAYGYARRRYAYPGGSAPENTRFLAATARAITARR